MNLLSRLKNLVVGNKKLIIAFSVGLIVALILMATYVAAIRSPGTSGETTRQTKNQQSTDTDNSTKEVQGGSSESNSANTGAKSGSASAPAQAGSASTPHQSPVCTRTPIPYTTTVQLGLASLGAGQYTISGGIEGYTESCTANSAGWKPQDRSVQPINRIIYVGTGGPTATTPPRTSPPEPDQYDRIVNDCSNILTGTGNNEAYQLCVSILVRYFGI